MTFNPDRRWAYLEPNTICSACGNIIDDDWSHMVNLCHSGRPVSGGPGYVVIVTEADIIRDFFPGWADRMMRIGKSDIITKENCVDDFVVVNWASEVKD